MRETSTTTRQRPVVTAADVIAAIDLALLLADRISGSLSPTAEDREPEDLFKHALHLGHYLALQRGTLDPVSYCIEMAGYAPDYDAASVLLLLAREKAAKWQGGGADA
jgi:hypothetical protein